MDRKTFPTCVGVFGAHGGAPRCRFARSLRIGGATLVILSGACLDTKASHEAAESSDYPEARITYSAGADSSDEFAGAPLSSVLLRDGGALMVDSRELSFRRVGADGQVLWRGGRQGSGPGEYLEISQVVESDSGLIQIFDRASMRLTTLSKEGTFMSSTKIPWLSKRNLHVIDVVSNGEFLVLSRRPRIVVDAGPSVEADMFDLSLVTTTGDTTKTIGEVHVGDAIFLSDSGVERAIPLVSGSTYAQRCGSAVRVYGGGKSQSIGFDGTAAALPQPAGLREPLEGGLASLIEQQSRSLRDQKLRERLSALVGGKSEAFQSKLVIPDRDGRLWLRALSRTSKGNYDAWDGDMKSDSLHVSSPRFFIDSNRGRLLAVVPESAETLSSVEVLQPSSSQAPVPVGENHGATHCAQAIRIPPP